MAAVRGEIATAASQLVAGDTFLFTYAGHGGVVPDVNGDEPSGQDQTMCLYDAQLVDDLLYADLGKFVAGVTVIVVSDSCHSGSVVRLALLESYKTSPVLSALLGPGVSRAMPPSIAGDVYLSHQSMYDDQQMGLTPESRDSIAASVVLLGACQDDQDAKEDVFHGKFTKALTTTWNGGKYLSRPNASYRDFVRRITKEMNDPTQIPSLLQVGARNPDLFKLPPF